MTIAREQVKRNHIGPGNPWVDPTNTINPRFFDFVAQMAHWGVLFSLNIIVGLVALWLGSWLVYSAFGASLAYATWHEFWHDPRYENEATRGSDLKDFFFLMLGSCAALIAFEILRFMLHQRPIR